MIHIPLDNAGIIAAAKKISEGKSVTDAELAAVRTAAKRARFSDTAAQNSQDAFKTQAAKDAGHTA